jgi:AcrR family transcriptional regulator
VTATARGLRTRQLILERSAHVFDQQGYAGATLNRLVESTGLTRGAFYFHFESKDALAAAIAEEQAERWHQLRREVERREQDPLRRLVTLVNATSFAYRDDATVRAAGRLLSDRGQINRAMPETAPWWKNTLATMLQSAADAGQLRDLSFLHREPAAADEPTAENDVTALAGYVVSQLAMIGLVAAAKANSQFDLLYTMWTMVLPRICADRSDEQALLDLVRAQLDPTTSGPV